MSALLLLDGFKKQPQYAAKLNGANELSRYVEQAYFAAGWQLKDAGSAKRPYIFFLYLSAVSGNRAALPRSRRFKNGHCCREWAEAFRQGNPPADWYEIGFSNGLNFGYFF